MSDRIDTSAEAVARLASFLDKWGSDDDVALVRALARERDVALSKPVRSEQHPDCVVLLESAWLAMGAELKAVREQRDALLAALRDVLEKVVRVEEESKSLISNTVWPFRVCGCSLGTESDQAVLAARAAIALSAEPAREPCKG